MRRTLQSAIPLVALGVVASFVLGQPLVAPGLVVGLALAIANHRVFQASAMRFTTDEGKLVRKPFAGSVALRLGGCTVVAFGLLYLVEPMGWGVVASLAAFQFVLLFQALIALLKYQKTQIDGTGRRMPSLALAKIEAVVTAACTQKPCIPVGDHVVRKIGGISLDVDTIWQTGVAAAIVLGMGFYLRRKATSGVPSRLQLFWELIVGSVSDQVESSLGPRYRRVVPLAVTIFMLVLCADWLEILPGLYHNTDFSPAPSADVNLTYALGILVFILTNAAGIRARGLKGYFAHFFRKPVAMFPLHILEELVKPLTLGLRLFGNLFAGGIMIALLLALPIYFAPATVIFTVLWKLFDMFIGVIQAFIFALLTILYYQFATESEAH